MAQFLPSDILVCHSSRFQVTLPLITAAPSFYVISIAKGIPCANLREQAGFSVIAILAANRPGHLHHRFN